MKREIEELGGTALSVETDVSSNSSVAEMANKTLQNTGKIDILKKIMRPYFRKLPWRHFGICRLKSGIER